MKHYFAIAFAAASIAFAGQAMAAEVDMSKLTCKEVAAMPAGRIVVVSMWMNGYAHGKAGNAMVDSDVAQANAEKIGDYCKNNPDATLASAIDAVAKS